MGIILGWNQFYNDYLSKKFSVPIWLALLIIIAILIAVSFRRSSNKPTKLTELKIIEGKEFGVQRINLDGFHFKRCTFTRSELIFSGRQSFSLSGNTLSDFSLTFENEAASTLSLLTTLYKDEGFRPFVQKAILNIQSGKLPNAPAVTAL